MLRLASKRIILLYGVMQRSQNTAYVYSTHSLHAYESA